MQVHARSADVPSDDPSMPLTSAVNHGDLAAVRELLRTAITQSDLDRALARAVLRFSERRSMAELLIAHGANPNGQYGGDYGPIALVTGECLDPDGMRFLADQGADLTFAPTPSKYGSVCMIGSVLGTYHRGDNPRKHRCLDLLLDLGAPIPATVGPAVLAIHRGDGDGLRRLLSDDPGLSTRRFSDLPYGNTLLSGGTLLHAAIEFDEHACIDALLAHGADPNARAAGDDGATPLFHCIALGWEVETGWGNKLATLGHLMDRCANRLDFTLRATVRRSDQSTPTPVMSPAELAASAKPAQGCPAATIAQCLADATVRQ
jgi:hypothetical protein